MKKNWLSKKRKSALILMPVIWDENVDFGDTIDPKEQKEKVDFLLDKGWKIKIINEIKQKHVVYSHILLEAE